MKWHTAVLSICDDFYRSNWPAGYSDADIKEMADLFREKGQLDVFFREYRNLPIATENATFQQTYFRYMSMDSPEYQELVVGNPNLEAVVLYDPSKDVQPQNDFSAIVGVLFDTTKNFFYVQDIFMDRVFPEQAYTEVCSMADRIGAGVIGYEVSGLNQFITYPFTNFVIARGTFYELIPLKDKGKQKNERIKSLIPFYRQGQFYHNPACCGPLETQLLSFPRSKWDDVMDALAYLIPLLDEGERFFKPRPTDGKDEFAGLDYDEPLTLNWQAI